MGGRPPGIPFLRASDLEGRAMLRYMVGGYEEYAVLSLVPVAGDHGVELPSELYLRWRRARVELDAAQGDVIAHLRSAGGREAIPEELWEAVDRFGAPVRPWDSR